MHTVNNFFNSFEKHTSHEGQQQPTVVSLYKVYVSAMLLHDTISIDQPENLNLGEFKRKFTKTVPLAIVHKLLARIMLT